MATKKTTAKKTAAPRPVSTLADLTPDPANARLHNPRNIGAIVTSLQALGAARSIVIDENNQIIAGNGTVEAAGLAGLERVRVIDADGSEIIAVRRSGLTAQQKIELALADNRTSDLSGWDTAVLAALKDAGEIDLGGLWNDDELIALLKDAGAPPPEDPGPELDKAAELQVKWQTAAGQLWLIGRHRLLIGDAREPETVSRLLSGDSPADMMMVTDAPYGVDYNPHWRDDSVGEFDTRAARGDGAENDDILDWTPAYSLFTGPVAYVWHAGRFSAEVSAHLTAGGYVIRSQIIWAKQHFAISRGNYHWQHEPCWYAVRKGKSAKWAGGRKQSTVWDISSLNPAGRVEERQPHGTQKPLEAMARPIRNHNFGVVYDPFVGSGTTLAACETLKRKGRALEIKPAYAAVTLERLSKMGLACTLSAP